ncbi:MAG: SMC-Scp complex subunit ScpB [Lachnospiraceae bacterium]|jgi:segregation and condensation protein B|nr:SMC-Scp complex subunit ScpB [Lachnospiraceae bacterium]MCR5211871.1 SMC-Scp complex subunit ScpB [Lachnospiraceae bacterium]
MDREELKSAVEGILFVMGNSVSSDTIASALEISKEEAEGLLSMLAAEYESNRRGIRITKLDDSYQMSSASEIYPYLIRIAKEPKKRVLTDTLLETLSVIAYKQPVTKAEIERVRGVSSEHAVNKLVEYDLVCEVGRLDAPGRPMLFGTTEEFLRSFGVSDIKDLPEPPEELLEKYRMEAEEEAGSGNKDSDNIITV